MLMLPTRLANYMHIYIRLFTRKRRGFVPSTYTQSATLRPTVNSTRTIPEHGQSGYTSMSDCRYDVLPSQLQTGWALDVQNLSLEMVTRVA